MVELFQIKPRQSSYFFKTVNERVSVNKQFARCFGHVQVVFEKFLYGEERFVVKRVYRTLFEDFLQKSLAKRCGKIINKSAYTEIVVRHDYFFNVKDLAYLYRDLRLFERAGKVAQRVDHGAYADNGTGVELAVQRVNYGTGKFFKVS